MLYTSSLLVFKKSTQNVKPYYVMKNEGNDVVVPEQSELEQYRTGVLTWQGLKVNFWERLMKPEAEEWMKRVSMEAAGSDVVLVSDEEDEHCYRVLLAERMVNMFSGHMNLSYAGELK